MILFNVLRLKLHKDVLYIFAAWSTFVPNVRRYMACSTDSSIHRLLYSQRESTESS